MRVIADLHIHSRFSAATSPRMDLGNLSLYARIKGLDLLGTGDALHPSWRRELKEQLEPSEDTGLYTLKGRKEAEPRFVVSTEVSTVYLKEGKTRKIHHVILLPNLEAAAQLADTLKNGNIESDGRPTLTIDPPNLVEIVHQISADAEVFPAHAWTPWFSVFGANNDYRSLEECYEDQSKRIHALETGLSSDPPMNWRLSRLDRLTLLSNSDCHSPQPHRLGREANVFELRRFTYRELVAAIRRNGGSSLLMTIETRPEYGKYHWTGHRACGVSLSPAEALRLQNRCPKCARKLTLGVEQRMEELADRPASFVPANAPSYVYLMPLHELLATILGASSIQALRVQELYTLLVKKFGSEYTVMLNAPEQDIQSLAGKAVVEAISAVRKNSVTVTPGYDGVYGIVRFDQAAEGQPTRRPSRGRPTMDDFLR